MNFDRSHFPSRSEASAAGMCRAAASSRATACSAALTMFDVGALTTSTPRSVAAGTSTLSSPMPARATTLSCGAAASASASIWVAERIITADGLGQGRQQRAPVGAVDVTDLHLAAQHLQDAGRELFGDQDDGRGRGHGGTA